MYRRETTPPVLNRCLFVFLGSISTSVGDHVLFPKAHLGVAAIAMKTSAAKPQSESHPKNRIQHHLQ